MSLSMNVKMDVREVERMLTKTQRTVIPKATSRALNVTAKAVQSRAVKLLAKDMGMTQKQMRQYLTLKKATWKNLRASITASSKRIPVHKLQAKQKPKGVTYKGRGGKRKLIPGAFIAPIRVDGVPGAYKRKGKARFPVKFLRTVSVPKSLIRNAIDKAMLKLARERWGKEFPHQVRFYLNRAGYRVR